MSETYKNKGFVTKYSSSPYDMIECTHIRLTTWIDYPTLSTKTMNEVFVKVTSNYDKYPFWDVYRDDHEESTPFKVESEYCSEPVKFNVIFYLKDDGTLSGYTQFSEVQVTSYITELWIYTSFRYGAEVSSLVLANSLETHIYEDIFGNLDDRGNGKDTYYPTHSVIDSTYLDTHQRFTNLIDHIRSDSNYSIFTINSILSSGVNSRLSITSPFLPYKNFRVGLYQDDLVICNWSEYLYKVVSLTKLDNRKEYVYYSGNIRVPSSSGGLGLEDYTISRLTPDYIVCSLSMNPSQEVVLVSLYDNEIGSKYWYETFIHDYYSYRSGYIVNNTPAETLIFRDRVTSDELFTKVTNSVVNNSIPGQLMDVTGSFCKFKVGNLYQYSNIEGTVISDRSDLKVLNDSCLFTQDDLNLYFYFTYNSSKVRTDGTEFDEKYKYLIYKVSRDDVSNKLITSLRRNAVRYESIPYIVDTYGGLMFYVDENSKLKVL